ncbi:MAG: hypothetical protein QN834_08320 [Nitrososphaeraceae archaeon]|nr:hypothetical protein [Nitrososphaeraceae archaeon]
MTPSPKDKIYKVMNPDGELYEIPEVNLDKAIELGGEVIDDIPLVGNEPSQASPPVQEKMFKVKNPEGEMYEIPESNLEKAKNLGGIVIEDAVATPENAQVPNKHEYSGENPTAAFAKNVGASVVGGLPDVGIGIANMTSSSGKPVHDPVTGEEFQAMEQIPYVTDMIANSIDKATSGYTKDTGAISKHAARFLGSLFGSGAAGKSIQALGASGKLGKASEATEKTGSFIANHLGITNPSVGNVSGALAGGGVVGFSEENNLPVYLQLPLILGAFILGNKGGNKATSVFKDSESLKPLFDRIPGLQNVINKGHYEDLAKNIKPEAIEDLLKTSLVEKETEFLTQKTLSELPPEIRSKIENNSALLTEPEIDLVVQKGMNDFTSQIDKLEKEYFPLTAGEHTGSPKLIAKEDSLANKPNVDNFDIALKDRKTKISKRIEKIKNDLSSKTSTSEELGDKIANEVSSVYSDAYKMRTDNWNKGFGKAVDDPILPIDDFKNKLQEFAKLRPDTEGNIVAIKAAKKRLNDGIAYDQKISPKRYNNILVGLNEDIRRFPDKTFSQKQMMELKSAAESGLTKAIENASTKEQASIIRNVRAQFAEDSKIINQIDESVLFSKINKDSLKIPEKIAQSLDNMPSSQLKLTFDALKRSEKHAEIIPEIQRYYIENAFKAATKDGPDTFNPRIFMDKLPKKPEFEVIFEGTNAYQEIKDMSVLFKRMRKFQPSRHNSKTAQRAQADRGDLEEVAEAATSAAKGDWFASLQKMLSMGGGSSYDRKIADLLLSPDHRKKILEGVGKTSNKKKTAVGIHAASNLIR